MQLRRKKKKNENKESLCSLCKRKSESRDLHQNSTHLKVHKATYCDAMNAFHKAKAVTHGFGQMESRA